MVYTSSNVRDRTPTKPHQMASKQSPNDIAPLPPNKNRSHSSNVHYHHQSPQHQQHQRRPDQHPVAQNSRQKAQSSRPIAAQNHRQMHDTPRSHLMSLPAIDHNNRHNSMATSRSNGDNSIDDHYYYSNCDDVDRRTVYNNNNSTTTTTVSNRSILNHHNCQPTDDIYMDAMNEVRSYETIYLTG